MYMYVVYAQNNYNCFYHQGKGYTRGVTKPQFERVLHFACLSVTPEEMNVSR